MVLSIDIRIIYAILIIIAIIILVIYFKKLILKIKGFFRRQELYGLSRENISKKWKEIEQLTGQNNEISYKLAIVEADKLLDHVLKSMMISGKDFGERLKVISYKYPDVKRAWFGHKIRNFLVHEASYHLDKKTAREALASFKYALIALGVL